MSCIGNVSDGIDGRLNLAIVDHQFYLHFRDEVDGILGATVNFRVPLLPPEARDLACRQALGTYLSQRFPHGIQFGRFNNCHYEFHGSILPLIINRQG